ncbi:MAG: glycosyl hydrolase family 65 protein [Candidatus Hydrogenedentota bacterium]
MTKTKPPEQTLYKHIRSEIVTDEWEMSYTDWNPDKQALREALCVLGNGYVATRGAFEEVEANGIHYPGTYLAGGYNRLKTEIAGRLIENEDLVNWPNWLSLSFRHHGGEWFNLSTVDILEFRQTLQVRQGTLERYVHFKDTEGRESTLRTRRFVCMDNQHLAAIEWVLTPKNWSGSIQIKSALDGTVKNQGVARYQRLNSQHLQPIETSRLGHDRILLVVEANQSHIRMVQAARTRVFTGEKESTAERKTWDRPGWIGQMIEVEARPQAPVRVEKTVSIFTNLDRAISEPVLEARKALARARDFSSLLTTHERAWKRLWDCCDLELGNDKHAQFVLRLHIFHLLQTCSVNTIDMDVGIPARGLHGEAYRGHIFWDEMFILPFLNLRMPELTRSVLKYRFRRLLEARTAAAEAGYRGAMFPWQSGSNGREESQELHLNPKSGRWIPDNTYLQRHVNATIAYNIWLYYEATGDTEFLYRFGAEMVLEIAKFWVSISVFNSKRDRYEIHHVVGPDEFHTKYPDSNEPGLNNNAYTNIMAAWVIRRALFMLDELPKSRITELMEKLDISEDDIEVWKTISRKMFVPMHGDRIISQFEGYEKLQEFDWDGYKKKYGDIERLDRILEAEGDTPNRYKAGKQADVLMLFYLFSLEELKSLFNWMGYDFDPEMLQRNVQYYVNRTSHGSTLSRVVHSWVLARTDRERSWGLFEQALESDVADIQGGTTSEGIHLGAMAGTMDLVQRGYSGLETRDGILWFKPHLPEELNHIQMRLYYRSNCIKIAITRESLTVSLAAGNLPPTQIGLNGKVHSIRPGETREFPS